VAAYPSTVYRLDEAGEVHEVVVEERDTMTIEVDQGPVAAMWPRVEQSWAKATWDEVAWWARQLGRPLRSNS
jgi:hypothetical protein